MVTDYLLFKSGGIDMSQGKTLNSRIKSKYKFNKLDNININDLELELENIINNKNNITSNSKGITYFISGHRGITQEDFNKNYAVEINNIINNSESDIINFVVGDYHGCDIMAQDYLLDTLQFNPEHVFVYHMFDTPRQVNPKVINLVGGFTSDEERDAAMTNISDYDIAYVYDHTKLSGTAQNILRRKLIKN
jgi:cupin superfamily acireductone dioxygenase involved in methionine salvage